MLLALVDKAPMITAATAGLLGLLLNLVLLGLVVWAIVVVIKLPELLERHAALQNQTVGQLREILAEIRSVTRQQ